MVHPGVGRNPRTGPEVLAALARDIQEFVRRAVAANPHTPARVLEQLMLDPSLSLTLMQNPAATPEVLEYLAAQVARDDFEGSYYDERNDLIVTITEHPNTPAHVLSLPPEADYWDATRAQHQALRLAAWHSHGARPSCGG